MSYHTINEEAARRANDMNSFRDYKAGERDRRVPSYGGRGYRAGRAPEAARGPHVP